MFTNTVYCGNIVSLPGSPKMGKPHIGKHTIVSYIAMLPKGKQARKHCFLAMLPKDGQTIKKHCR
jgi:hypothetical protein